jgi:hypothetical protein
LATIQVILLNGTTADANEVMQDFNEIYTNIDNSNIAANAGIAYSKLATLASGRIIVGSAGGVATSVVMSGDATISNTGVVTVTSAPTPAGAVPIGTIIPFYDYNGTLTFDAARFTYCNGGTATFTGIGLQTLPDLSGRYLVGFGTDGGGNNGSAAWATAAVGNAGNTINIAHTHTVAGHTHTGPSHTHDMGNHTHTVGNHTHGPGTLQFSVLFYDAGGGGGLGRLRGFTSGGASSTITEGVTAGTGASFAFNSEFATPNTTYYTASGTGVTDTSSGTSGAPSTNTTSADGTGATGSASPATDSQLSSTQSIQPISIRVRWLIRYT